MVDVFLFICVQAIEVVEETGDKAAAFHLARQLENAVSVFCVWSSVEIHTYVLMYTVHLQ